MTLLGYLCYLIAILLHILNKLYNLKFKDNEFQYNWKIETDDSIVIYIYKFTFWYLILNNILILMKLMAYWTKMLIIYYT